MVFIKYNSNNFDYKKNVNEQIYNKILNWFHNFSYKHNINYSIAYGTMLGYVRNKDYIPYDKDLDLYIGKEDAYNIIKLIDNDTIIYNSDIKQIEENKIYIIINKQHDLKIEGRNRYDCNGNKVLNQMDVCSFNGLFGRIIYNNINCDLFVYSTDNNKNDYSDTCNDTNCVYIATHKGTKIPETKNIKLNNATTKIFKFDEFVNNMLFTKYGKNFLNPDHKYINGIWVKI
tara:strand:- start:5486 stop:6175 length:690 start_codon:yes stop_codon:yes gene_type:complete